MIVLGIETSGLDGSIALTQDGECLGESALNAPGRRHAQSLVLEIRQLLTANDLKAGDVDAVAVSRGPGSFTGLRVGMVCAKTFAYATSCRFIAVDTFASIAENLAATADRTLIVEDAQRDDLFVGEYHRNELGRWFQFSPIQIESVERFLERASQWTDIVTGPGLKKLDPDAMSSKWLTQPEYSRSRAVSIAGLGQRILSNPVVDESNDSDFWKAVPFYLRQSAAEEKRAKS